MGTCSTTAAPPETFKAKPKKPLRPELEANLDAVAASKEAEDKERDELFKQNGKGGGGGEGGGNVMSEAEMRIERAKARTQKAGQAAIDKNSDTIETLYSQIEQSRNDNRKLTAMNEKLAESEAYLRELNMGMWSIFKKGKKFDLPELNQDDIEIPVTMNKGIFNQNEKWTLRFTHTVMMRIDKNKELSDTAAYRQITGVNVKQKEGYVDILLDNKALQTADDRITVNCDQNVAFLVRTLYSRNHDAEQEELRVIFEEGAEKFDYHPAPSKADRMARHSPSPQGLMAAAPAEKDPWGLDDDDEWLDGTMDQLNTIEMQGKEMHNQFVTHEKVLDRQQKLVEETNARTHMMTDEAYKADKIIGGKGRVQDESLLPSGGGLARAAVGM